MHTSELSIWCLLSNSCEIFWQDFQYFRKYFEFLWVSLFGTDSLIVLENLQHPLSQS